MEYLSFEVAGAGTIRISKDCHCITGDVAGFDFLVSWGSYGWRGGGVLGRDEAKRMAEFILQKCNETPESMGEEVSKFYRNLKTS